MRVVGGSLWALLFASVSGCTFSDNLSSSGSNVLAWDVSANRNWTDADEAEFSRWVQAIGEGRVAKKCIFFTDCIKNPNVNFLHTDEDNAIRMLPDCADIPGTMRAYFAYKKQLPFMFVFEITGKLDGRNDMRYATEIVPTLVMNQSSIKTIHDLFESIRQVVSTAFYRMAPNVEGNDTFPVKVSRDAIRPGTVYYDAAGHVMMVYKVENDGTVRFIQGHPADDKAGAYFTTTSLSSKEHNRASALTGAGFRNWRGYVYENGRLVFRSNAQEPTFSSTDQFRITFPTFDGKESNYFEYVRSALCLPGECGVKPTAVASQFKKICTDISERVLAVESATAVEIFKKPHPGIPEDVYGGPSEWEGASTPSRDTRLRGAFAQAHEMIASMTTMVANRDPRISFTGTPSELIALFQNDWNSAVASSACQYAFTGSDGRSVAFDLAAVEERLFDLSFDPYHCPELRWGIRQSDACPVDDVKDAAYERETGLRNITDADKRPPSGPGQLDEAPQSPPDVSVSRLLAVLAANPPAQKPSGGGTIIVTPPPATPNSSCEKVVLKTAAFVFPTPKEDFSNFITTIAQGDVLTKLKDVGKFYYVANADPSNSRLPPLYGDKGYILKSVVECKP